MTICLKFAFARSAATLLVIHVFKIIFILKVVGEGVDVDIGGLVVGGGGVL